MLVPDGGVVTNGQDSAILLSFLVSLAACTMEEDTSSRRTLVSRDVEQQSPARAEKSEQELAIDPFLVFFKVTWHC